MGTKHERALKVGENSFRIKEESLSVRKTGIKRGCVKKVFEGGEKRKIWVGITA